MRESVRFGERLWTMSGDEIRTFGVPFPTRMTVAQLTTGELWVHSPVVPAPEGQRAIDALGPVLHLVAPNRFHSLGVKPWKARYPSARVWVSPRFRQRHPELPADEGLKNGTPDAWRAELEAHHFTEARFSMKSSSCTARQRP
jgi:hypothetical protein